MDVIRPDANLTLVDVQGVEDETGVAGDWSVIAHAICANSVPGLQRVANTGPVSSLNKNRGAKCPTGKRLLGAGAEIGGGGGQVMIDDIRPDAALTKVTVTAVEDENGFAGNWSVTAYAICANSIAGLERVSVTSPNNSTFRSVTASCPVGKNLVGVAAERTGGAAEAAIDVIRPDVTLTSVLVLAAEDETGYAGNWSITAHAICANASQRVSAELAATSNSKGTSRFCPLGKQVVGLGGDVTGGNGQVVMEDIRTNGILESGGVQAFEDGNGFAGLWSLRAYAVCTTPLPGLQLVTAASAVNSNSFRSVTAPCPAGKQVVGMGAETDPSGAGQVVIEDMFPNSFLTNATVEGFEDEDGLAGNWGLLVQTICADPVPGLDLVSVDSEFDSDAHSATATCPAGKNLLGLAGNVNTNGFGQVVIDDLRPSANLRSVVLTAFEDENGFGGPWNLTAHAFCANP